MRYIITGAGGFIGKALVNTLRSEQPDAELVLADTSFTNKPPSFNSEKIQLVEGDLRERSVRDALLNGGITTIYHLAALPGGTSEQNPELSKAVNLDATLALFEEAADANLGPKPLKVVYASTIAVLGEAFPKIVNDDYAPAPTLTYGAHKAMVELAIADMSRRKCIDGISIRLPGIVARPYAKNGLKSAFMSDVFHALLAKKPFECPVSPAASMWLSSVSTCSSNIATAGNVSTHSLHSSRTVNLPVVHCTMGELCNEIAAQAGANASLVTYAPNDALEAKFGCYPPIRTVRAMELGFGSDDSLKNLVSNTLNTISNQDS